MDVAPRYTLLRLFTLLTLFSLCFFCFNSLNSSMYAYILLGKFRMLLEWADGLLSKMWEWVSGLGDG